jgi:hypothetical protein
MTAKHGDKIGKTLAKYGRNPSKAGQMIPAGECLRERRFVGEL